jgi:hypothetical protein
MRPYGFVHKQQGMGHRRASSHQMSALFRADGGREVESNKMLAAATNAIKLVLQNVRPPSKLPFFRKSTVTLLTIIKKTKKVLTFSA